MSSLPRVGESLVATVDLARGAKITSLVDRAGHEWLLPPRPDVPPRSTPFVAAEMGGWDECAPTIDASPGPDGRPLPDHGDLWDAAWAGTATQHSVRGRSMPYELTRTIRAIADGLRLDYTVVADLDTPFVWAAHPQFRAPAGTRVVLPGVTRVVDVHDPAQPAVAWPGGLDTIEAVERHRKLYADPDVAADRAALHVPGRASTLTMRWDGRVAPYLGLWFDRASLAREPVIAIEPSTGYFDSPARAAANGRVLRLRAGVPVRWFVEIGVIPA